MLLLLQESARKQFECQIAEENRRIALAKTLERTQQRQAEVQELQQQMLEVRGTNFAWWWGGGEWRGPECGLGRQGPGQDCAGQDTLERTQQRQAEVQELQQQMLEAIHAWDCAGWGGGGGCMRWEAMGRPGSSALKGVTTHQHQQRQEEVQELQQQMLKVQRTGWGWPSAFDSHSLYTF